MKPRWEEFCVVCGGPPDFNSMSSTAGRSGATRISTDWLSDWQGVTPEQPDQPIDIGRYDGHGCWRLPDFDDAQMPPPDGSIFASYGEWFKAIGGNEAEHDRLYGPPDTCECSPPASDDEEEDDDDEEDPEPIVCPNHAPEPGLHWLEGWWGGDSCWARYGVALHRSCGQLLRQQLGYSLNFNHIWPLLAQPTSTPHPPWPSSNHLVDISYGGAEVYHGGDPWGFAGEKTGSAFLVSHMSPADEYMLLDPLGCGGNAARILRIWGPMVKGFQRAERRSGSMRSSSGGAGRGSGGAVSVRGRRGRAGRGGGAAAAAAAATAAGGSRGSQLLLQPSPRMTRGAASRARVSVSTCQCLELAASCLTMVMHMLARVCDVAYIGCLRAH